MKTVVFLLFFTVFEVSSIQINGALDQLWSNFKVLFGKRYNNHEDVMRRSMWEKRVQEVIHHNLKADLGLFKYKKGLNEHSDKNPSELAKILNGFRRNLFMSKNGNTWIDPLNVRIPDQIDWRDEGLVTPVKSDQGCGSWAFSATGSLEGQHKKKTGQLIALSQQNLIDCARTIGPNGCSGGLVDYALQYVIDNDGIDTEESYPFTGMDGQPCSFKRANVGATCTGYVDIPSGNEDALMKAVATIGPISVLIDASHDSFQLYKSGIYDEPNCIDQVDHATLVVGYGTEDGNDYWIVKNSWGTSWGESGYVRMTRNSGNQCGIASYASYPVV